MVKQTLHHLSGILFIAMVPLMPITLFAMYVIMDRLGLIGL